VKITQLNDWIQMEFKIWYRKFPSFYEGCEHHVRKSPANESYSAIMKYMQEEFFSLRQGRVSHETDYISTPGMRSENACTLVLISFHLQ
jgi:hypothetical protein